MLPIALKNRPNFFNLFKKNVLLYLYIKTISPVHLWKYWPNLEIMVIVMNQSFSYSFGPPYWPKNFPTLAKFGKTPKTGGIGGTPWPPRKGIFKSEITAKSFILDPLNVLSTNRNMPVNFLKKYVSRSFKVNWWRHHQFFDFYRRVFL